MELTDRTLLDRLKIDKLHLDKEWNDQPQLMEEISSNLALAIRIRDEKANELEQIEADISLSIRESPRDYNIVNATEGAVRAAIILEPSVKEAKAALVKAEWVVNTLKGASKACDHRKDALFWLSKLFLSNYYGSNLPQDREIDKKLEESWAEEESRQLGMSPRLQRLGAKKKGGAGNGN
jgi:hypothetical protein